MLIKKQTPPVAGFFKRNIHLFILGGAFVTSFLSLIFVYKFGATKVTSFGPKAQIYLLGIKNGLTISTLILSVSLFFSLFLGKYLVSIEKKIENFYNSLTNTKRNLIILTLCFVFLFASHAGNIMNGYFNMDDLEIIGLNNSLSFTESVLIPHGNDHVFPLFITEMKAIYSIFGTNEIPYNILVFIILALTPFFTYLTFERLGFSVVTSLIFILVFSGAANWAEMLTGFYIMSVYPQIIFFFSVAIWSYIAWLQSKNKKYMMFFGISIVAALISDTSGIWVLPAIVLFMISVYYINKTEGSFEKQLI